MANILLLRVPSQGEDDRYAATFTQAGYRALPVPVLETVWCNLPTLKSIIEAGPRAAGFEGVILTSARSSEAWKTVVEDLADTSSDPGNDGWSTIPFYVVGEATAAVLKQMQQGTPYTPQIIRGEASGTGKRLAQFICEQADGKPKKLLYLTGDKNRDTVPTILAQAGVEFRSLKVYETQGSCTFARDLKDALKIASADFKHWWIIYFAPSAAEFVTPIMNDYFDLTPSLSGAERPISSPRVAAIGPVTSSFLRDKLKIHVDVVPPNPTPQDLLAAIIAHDRNF